MATLGASGYAFFGEKRISAIASGPYGFLSVYWCGNSLMGEMEAASRFMMAA